ncbi:MAG: hypothetical protein JSS98_13535 [Bacteroidetes bacterium]|nr:hypothetical protein [Bacteroidota bacterium]
MKKITPHHVFLFCTLFIAILLNGCVKDSITRTYSYSFFAPVYKTTAEVKANIKSNAPQDLVNTGKLVILGNYVFLNEIDKGIHIIDNSNPASPRNVAFIDIPGNIDIALKGNTLYADLYTDLVTLDISNPMQVSVKKYNEGVFPYRSYSNALEYDSTKIIVRWEKRDTTVTVKVNNTSGPLTQYYTSAGVFNNSGIKNSSAPIGIGGSMARFAIVDKRLYTVSNSDLNVFNIAAPNDPTFSKKVNVGGFNIETIFPFKDKLFIGSQNGMFVYNITNVDNPALVGQFSHVQSCDPVIADDNYAYVTLRTGTSCFGNANQLEILQLNSFTNPILVKGYPFTNPHGLSKDGNLLFVCDGSDGLKIYNASNVSNLQKIKQFSGLAAYDVIAYNHIALMVAKDGLYQYDYSDVNNIHLISKIAITAN